MWAIQRATAPLSKSLKTPQLFYFCKCFYRQPNGLKLQQPRATPWEACINTNRSLKDCKIDLEVSCSPTGCDSCLHIVPRALPWAVALLAFQANENGQ